MPIGMYTMHQLMRVIEDRVPTLQPYWLNFFTSEVQSESDTIDFDIVTKQNYLAPFVYPTNQGKVYRDRGYSTKQFSPAYLKPKHAVDVTKLIRRRPGESYVVGELGMEQRRQLLIAQNLEDERDMILRRWEWMAAQAVMTGEVTVAGEDYPTVVVSFGRDAGQTITLLGTDLWTDQANSDPMEDLETWAQQIHTRTGYVLSRITMGHNAWRAFKKHPAVKDALDLNYRGSVTTVDRDPLLKKSAQIVGRLSGTVEIWVYADSYVDDEGNTVQMMNQDWVVLTASEGIEGIRAFGAIKDGKAGFKTLSMFPKNWEQGDDPWAEFTMTQSAPLMIPLRPDCTLRAKVV